MKLYRNLACQRKRSFENKRSFCNDSVKDTTSNIYSKILGDVIWNSISVYERATAKELTKFVISLN